MIGESEQKVTASTDTAALSAGAVAVVVSLFITPGIYGIINLIISLTLVLVILAYVWPHARGWVQSLAVGAAIGLASIPGIGFFLEVVRSRAPIAHLFGSYSWECGLDPCNAQGDGETRVTDIDLTIGWLLIAVIVVAADRIGQRRKST